ncbi:MAG: PDZ domain-containing protein, partial [Acidobacteria bacterium]|nr:PDZ domain-containing protein [Acidobacteriota bacterium]
MFAFMRDFFERFDRLADINRDGGAVAWLERIAFVFLLLTFASAPHSIAATQTAWIIGMLAWIIRLPLRPRIRFRFGPLDAALWAFFIWSVVSSFTSYEPLISIDRLRGTAVFLIFYFVYYNIRTMRAASLAAGLMIVSSMISVFWMPVERLLGRGVEIHGVAANSPLAKPGLIDGDTLLEVNKKKVTTPDEVVKGLESAENSKVRFYRPDFELTIDVKRSDLLAGTGALEQLGITGWEKSHNWRSKGFYGHYTTYAEVLQLIGSLIFGLFIAGLASLGFGRRSGGSDNAKAMASRPLIGLLFLALLGTGLALLLTVTRGPQLGLAVSGGLIVLAGLGRR